MEAQLGAIMILSFFIVLQRCLCLFEIFVILFLAMFGVDDYICCFAFFMSLTPLLYRYPTIALYDRAAASRKEEFGILAVLSHSHHLCDQHVQCTLYQCSRLLSCYIQMVIIIIYQ